MTLDFQSIHETSSLGQIAAFFDGKLKLGMGNCSTSIFGCFTIPVVDVDSLYVYMWIRDDKGVLSFLSFPSIQVQSHQNMYEPPKTVPVSNVTNDVQATIRLLGL